MSNRHSWCDVSLYVNILQCEDYSIHSIQNNRWDQIKDLVDKHYIWNKIIHDMLLYVCMSAKTRTLNIISQQCVSSKSNCFII